MPDAANELDRILGDGGKTGTDLLAGEGREVKAIDADGARAYFQKS